MLKRGEKANFKTVQKAAKAGQLALLECTDAKTGNRVPVIVAVNVTRQPDEEAYEFIPLARMFTGNPYDEVLPPDARRADA